MKPFAGYENVQVSDFEKLPKGAYEVKIMDAKEVTYTGKDGSAFSKLETVSYTHLTLPTIA